MTPQLVDLNADGHNDMVTATFEGTAFFMKGTKDGFKAPEYIVDEKGENVRISAYYDEDTEDFEFVDRSTEGEEYHEDLQMTSIAVVDWDADGDLDLVLGAYEGAMYLCKNNGTAKQPKFSATNLQIKVGDEHILKFELATPRIADWNGDGLFDILCSSLNGGVYYYKNTGTKGSPEFAAGKTLLSGFGERKVPAKDGQPTRPGMDSYIEVVDYDGDGDLDLLVGSSSNYTHEKIVLSEEEEEELKKLQAQGAILRKKITQLFKTGKDQKEVFRSNEYKKIAKESMNITNQIHELNPPKWPASYIWLYRNNTDSTS